MTNPISNDRLSLLYGSENSLSRYSFDNYEAQLDYNTEEMRNVQSSYNALNNQITSIDKEIARINSLEEPHYHSGYCDDHGCNIVNTPGQTMSSGEKARRTKELEMQKMQVDFQLNQAGRELISAQRSSYRDSYLQQMGIKSSGTLKLNTSFLDGIDSSKSEVGKVVSNFKGAWFNKSWGEVKRTRGHFGH